MGYYLKSKILTKDMLGEETRTLKHLKSFASGTLKDILSKKFPIDAFGNMDDFLKIKGVKALIDSFDEIDSEKFDIVAQYKNITFEGVNGDKQLVIKFPEEDIEAHSIYNVYSEFLDFFSLTKYANYCIRNNHIDIVKKNIDWLLTYNGDKEKQFRLIKDDNDTWGIRGITSTGYKKYDNSIVIYLSLLALHKYSVEKNKSYSTVYAYISDSSLNIFFEQDEPVNLSGVGKIYLGLAISNGEIRNKTFKAELRYRIVNPDSNESFAAIYNSPIFSVFHNMNVETIDKHLDNLFKMENQEESLLLFIKNLNLSEHLSEDAFYLMVRNLLVRINDCSDISRKTKDEFKKIETERLINNTYNLMQLFGKLNSISTDVDEKIFVERIIHKVIIDICRNK